MLEAFAKEVGTDQGELVLRYPGSTCYADAVIGLFLSACLTAPFTLDSGTQ